ncbi:hypothetical protein LZK77_16410 [Rhizobium leguminosarum]|nr:hypothetical protein LZK77_16410 [Rhizobium leguminosarum]
MGDFEPSAEIPLGKFGLNASAYKEHFVFHPLVSAHPFLRRHQMLNPERNAGKLVAFLNDAIWNGTAVTGNLGRLNRTWICENINIEPTTLSTDYGIIVQDYDRIVHDYDSVVPSKGFPVEKRLREMRLWLEEQIADGTLEIRDGKFSRKDFYEQFDIAPTATYGIRYPEVAALFEEFDGLILSSGYLPKVWREEAQRLSALLENDPPLAVNGRTINHRAIEDELGFPRYACKRRRHLAEIVLKAEADLHRRIAKDPIIAVMCGRLFKFDPLLRQGWSYAFTIRFKQAFERRYQSRPKTEVQQMYWQAVDLMAFLWNNPSRSCAQIRDALSSGADLREVDRDWVLVTLEFRAHLRSKNAETGTCNNKIAFINSVFGAMGNEGVLPVLDLPIRPFRDDNETHIRSVAEVLPDTPPTRGKPHVDEYLNFAMSKLSEGAELREIEISAEEQSDFTNVLRYELERQELNAADDPAGVILRVLTRRLDLMSAAAFSIVKGGREAFAYGQKVMDEAEDLGSDWDVIIGRDGNENDRKAVLRRYFPEDSSLRDRAVGNLLNLVATRFDYHMPQQSTFGGRNAQFFKHRAIEYGGARLLKQYLFPDTRTIAGVITLYLLASGSNVSVGRTLNWDCLEEAEQERHWKITGYKARAKGKPIFTILEERSPAVQSILWLQDALAPMRNFTEKDASQLFLVEARRISGFKMIEEWTYRNHFKEIIANDPELGDLPLTPNMIRPSILLKAVLENDGQTRLSRALGQHTDGVHKGYTDKYPTRELHDRDVRHFTHSMETIIIRAEEAQAFLGIDTANFTRRVEAVMKTGLGTMCADRQGRPGNEGSPCTSVDCWNECPQLILIARKQDMAVLQIWQASLREVEGDWVRDQPQRWGEVWLPWLCFVDAVEIKMRQSFPTIWRDATQLSREMMATPGYSHMRLF